MSTFNFVGNVNSVTVNTSGGHGTYPKNAIVARATTPEDRAINISSLLFPSFLMNLDEDDIQIDGVTTTATTATELVDELSGFFFR